MRVSRRLLALLVLSLGCRDLTGIADDLRVRTDRTAYVVADDSLAPIRLQLDNVGTAPLDVPRCRTVTIYVDQWIAAAWVEVARVGEICPAIYDMTPLRLSSGHTHESSALELDEGRYRVRVPFSRAGEDFRRHTAYSNVFTVQAGP